MFTDINLASRLSLSGLVLTFAVLVTSCGKEPSSARVHKVFEQEDFVSVDDSLSNIPDRFKKIVNAIGRMKPQCSASHIGNGIVLTAGHCVGGTQSLRKGVACDSVTIEWGVKESNLPQAVSTCEKILAMQVNDLIDFAILKVKEFPNEHFEVSLTKESNETSISVFGYPGGQSLKWSQYCKITNQGQASFALLGFAHQCDTQVGSSGGPVVLSESGTLTGIHNGGDSASNYATNLADIGLEEFLGLASAPAPQ